MTDNDKRSVEEIPADAVIQALKCCTSAEYNCHHCPFKGVGITSDSCITAMSRAALDLIYRKQSEWVSIAERLPEKSGRYLVYGSFAGMPLICGAHYDKHNGFGDDDFTHWMPLPEPPVTKGA